MTEIVQAVVRLQSQLSRAEEMADSIAFMLKDRGGMSAEPRPTEPLPTKAAVRKRRFNDPWLFVLARPGVGTMEMWNLDRRTVAVSIDGAQAFNLSPGLAELLRVLASAQQPDQDGFPPFRSFTELAAAMQAATGRPCSERAVVVGISRLRWLLQHVGGKSAQLVETQRNRGARFRLRLVKKKS